MQTVTNTKTGNIGAVKSRYNRTTDGKAMIEVVTLTGQKAFWITSHCEVA